MVDLALLLSPIAVMAAGGGPTNVMPDWEHNEAKCAFSDRKPYPGWIAVEPVERAAWMMVGVWR